MKRSDHVPPFVWKRSRTVLTIKKSWLRWLSVTFHRGANPLASRVQETTSSSLSVFGLRKFYVPHVSSQLKTNHSHADLARLKVHQLKVGSLFFLGLFLFVDRSVLWKRQSKCSLRKHKSDICPWYSRRCLHRPVSFKIYFIFLLTFMEKWRVVLESVVCVDNMP